MSSVSSLLSGLWRHCYDVLQQQKVACSAAGSRPHSCSNACQTSHQYTVSRRLYVSACDRYQLVMAFIHTPRLPADVEVPIYHAIVQSAQDIHEKPTRLEIIIITPGDDNIVDLQHHPTKLRCQHQLLLLANQRIDDECITHVVASSLHTVDA